MAKVAGVTRLTFCSWFLDHCTFSDLLYEFFSDGSVRTWETCPYLRPAHRLQIPRPALHPSETVRKLLWTPVVFAHGLLPQHGDPWAHATPMQAF